MFTVLRITGLSDQLASILEIAAMKSADLLPEINRRGDLVFNLSQALHPDHWNDVVDALDSITDHIKEADAADIGLLVDTMFDLKELPDGGVAMDTLFVPNFAINAMSRARADFEATIYRPMSDDATET